MIRQLPSKPSRKISGHGGNRVEWWLRFGGRSWIDRVEVGAGLISIPRLQISISDFDTTEIEVMARFAMQF